MSQEPQESGGSDEPGGRWIEAAVIALLVALAPVRIIGKLADLDVPLWVHAVLFVIFTVVIERALRSARKPDTNGR